MFNDYEYWYQYYCKQCRKESYKEAGRIWFWEHLKPPGSPHCDICGEARKYVKLHKFKNH